jgi:hypothetical protein
VRRECAQRRKTLRVLFERARVEKYRRVYGFCKKREFTVGEGMGKPRGFSEVCGGGSRLFFHPRARRGLQLREFRGGFLDGSKRNMHI